LEEQFFSLSLASLLRPVQLGRPYQEHKVPAGVARKVIEARKPPHHGKVETFGGVIIYLLMHSLKSASMQQKYTKKNLQQKMHMYKNKDIKYCFKGAYYYYYYLLRVPL
jgi:hypothetical protein